MQFVSPEEVGARLKEARNEKNLSLRDVEEKTGITNPWVSQLEQGKCENPGVKTVMRLCDLYGISLEDLYLTEAA